MEKTEEKNSMNTTTMAATITPDLKTPFEYCLIENKPDPCIIVVFGASGDLTSRKIIPALFNLYVNNALPYPFLVVGCAHTKLSNHEFKDKMKNA